MGWGKHAELADPIPQPVLDPAGALEVEVFHWNMSQDSARRMEVPGVQALLMSLMRGQVDALQDMLADAPHWAEHGITWRKVADVATTDFNVAFGRTNHIDSDWTLNEEVHRHGATWPNEPARSTSVGDIMRIGDRIEVVSSFGFTPLPPACSAWLDGACTLHKPGNSPAP